MQLSFVSAVVSKSYYGTSAWRWCSSPKNVNTGIRFRLREDSDTASSLIETRTTNLRLHIAVPSIALFSSLSYSALRARFAGQIYHLLAPYKFLLKFFSPWASYPQRSTDMHLLSPAHLFSMVLLSIVLGVMTMAVPLTVHNTDIGKWQWHSKRDVNREFTVGLIRRSGQEQQLSANPWTLLPTIIRSDSAFHTEEYWHLYITRRHSFHAVQMGQVWQFKQVDHVKPVYPKLSLGSITLPSDARSIKANAQRLNFAALNALINFLLEENLPEGLKYTPCPKDPDAWTKIFLAMTDYDRYLETYPNLNDKPRYVKLLDKPDGTTVAPQAASNSEGMSQLSTTSGGQSAGGREAQVTQGKSVKEQMGGMSSSTDPMRISNLLGPQKNGKQTQGMKISNLLGSANDVTIERKPYADAISTQLLVVGLTMYHWIWEKKVTEYAVGAIDKTTKD
ncbi:hypothetical protein DFJ43DRAFT_1136899 [Lentinula guzmanii]|uniref:Uncharacterized protein n=1 Tax=Lentinula guzmanii TaxID=2804957 RepID=A0AA38JRJ3_9AGAR|nr:hypothetical protein DFJ43DRAFT_1136899 [Lentinula guzmanii]